MRIYRRLGGVSEADTESNLIKKYLHYLRSLQIIQPTGSKLAFNTCSYNSLRPLMGCKIFR